MEELRYYKATDGSLFDTREKCEIYEGNRKENVINRFKKLIYKEADTIDVTKEGSAFPFAEIAEDWYVGIMIITNDDEYQTVVDYAKLCNYKREIPKIFGQKIIVGLGWGKTHYDEFYVYGTVDDAVEKYRKALDSFGN